MKAALKPGGHAIVNVDAPVREWRKGYGTERGFHAWLREWDEPARVELHTINNIVPELTVPKALAFADLVF